MLEPDILEEVRAQIAALAQEDRRRIDGLRADVQRLQVFKIKPRTTTSVALVASDGGNNALRFDPLLIHVVRVMDSKGKQQCLDVVSQATDIAALSRRVRDHGDRNPLGILMDDLGVRDLWELSHMVPRPGTKPDDINPSWPLVYRDLCEWAALYRLITRTTFATDTLVVRDGLLKSKLFRGELFVRACDRMMDAIDTHRRSERAHIWLVGIAKSSKIIERYRLAMALERVFPAGEPCYAPVPDELAVSTYQWDEYVRAPVPQEGKEAPKFNYGALHVVRFGRASGDPIWVVDIAYPQRDQHEKVVAYLLQDAADGFPVPFYPRCLQRAHEHAQLVDLDIEILQDAIYGALRDRIAPEDRPILDAMRLNPDPARLRYERE